MRKVALITGASGDIGSALARAFAAEGLDLALHYGASAGRAKKLQHELKQTGCTCETFRADLSRPSAPASLIKGVYSRFGRLDVLVNNAGLHPGKKDFQTLSLAEWDKAFRVNNTAPFFLAREAYKRMSSGGRIINISTVSAKFGGSARSLHYAASKAALETWTQGLARLGAPRNILVNAIRAGMIDTSVHKRSGTDLSARVSFIPLKRMGKPADVARLAVFLAGEGGDYITGQVLPLTGGE